MTTCTKSKCKVMFAQCSGNSIISSCSVCITLLNSEDVPTIRSISISQILVLPDITDVKVLSISQLFLCPCHFPCFTRFLPHLSHLPRSLSQIPRNHDNGVVPMIAELRPRSQPWCGIVSPRVVLNVFLSREFCCFSCFSYIA